MSKFLHLKLIYLTGCFSFTTNTTRLWYPKLEQWEPNSIDKFSFPFFFPYENLKNWVWLHITTTRKLWAAHEQLDFQDNGERLEPWSWTFFISSTTPRRGQEFPSFLWMLQRFCKFPCALIWKKKLIKYYE